MIGEIGHEWVNMQFYLEKLNFIMVFYKNAILINSLF